MGHRQENSDREGHEGFHGNAKVSLKARQYRKEKVATGNKRRKAMKELVLISLRLPSSFLEISESFSITH